MVCEEQASGFRPEQGTMCRSCWTHWRVGDGEFTSHVLHPAKGGRAPRNQGSRARGRLGEAEPQGLQGIILGRKQFYADSMTKINLRTQRRHVSFFSFFRMMMMNSRKYRSNLDTRQQRSNSKHTKMPDDLVQPVKSSKALAAFRM